MEEQSVRLSRLQLYKEIWELSVSGVAKKYNVRYADLLVNCKEWNIPVPPSGYWTKVSHGKTVSQTPLPESTIAEIMLSSSTTPKRAKRSNKDVNQPEQTEGKSEESNSVSQEKEQLQDGIPALAEEDESIYGHL